MEIITALTREEEQAREEWLQKQETREAINHVLDSIAAVANRFRRKEFPATTIDDPSEDMYLLDESPRIILLD